MSITSLLLFIFTLIGYFITKKLYRRVPYLIFSPPIFLPIIIIIMISILGISYDTYMLYNKWLVWLIGPATVAFALPIYEFRAVIRDHFLSITFGVIGAMTTGLIISALLAYLFHFNELITYSLMARIVSTPFAIEVMRSLPEDEVELSIVLTMITGIVGVFISDVVLTKIKVNHHISRGAAMGTSSQGIGVAKAFLKDRQTGVVACLSMIISGFFMVFFGPFLIQMITNYLNFN